MLGIGRAIPEKHALRRVFGERGGMGWHEANLRRARSGRRPGPLAHAQEAARHELVDLHLAPGRGTSEGSGPGVKVRLHCSPLAPRFKKRQWEILPRRGPGGCEERGACGPGGSRWGAPPGTTPGGTQ